jgi:hypothetical protein
MEIVKKASHSQHQIVPISIVDLQPLDLTSQTLISTKEVLNSMSKKDE